MDGQKPVSGSEFLKASPSYCCQFTGDGAQTEIESTSISVIIKPFWIHLNCNNSDSVNWINSTAYLPEIVKLSFLNKKQSTQSIRFDIDDGMLMVLRGVGLDATQKIDISTFLCFYITDNYIISASYQDLNVVTEMQKAFNYKIGAVDVADWLVKVIEQISNYFYEATNKVYDLVDHLEENVFSLEETTSHKQISIIRHQLMLLRRIIGSDQNLFMKVSTERLTWIDDHDRQHLHDLASCFAHYMSDIDFSITRLATVVDQMNAIVTEQMNKRVYIMSILATIFMPLTFLASLLGVNLSGIPFSQNFFAFWGFVSLLVLLGGFLYIWMWKKKWL